MSIKLMMFGRRRKGQTLAEHRIHMKDVHGQYVMDYRAADPVHAPRHYVQNHAFDGIYPGGTDLPPAFASGLDFITEIWFDDLAGLAASRQTDFYRERLQPDEPRMVDEASVIGLPVREEVVRAVAPHPAGLTKVFLAWHAVDLGEAMVPGFDLLAQQAPGHCRNRPAVPSSLQAIDEFWLAGEAEGIAFAQSIRDLVCTHHPEQASFTLTVAREHVFTAA